MATRRIPHALTFSMLIAAVSLGVMTIAWNVSWPVDQSIALLVHLSAGMCLIWMLASVALPRFRPDLAGRQRGRDMIAVLNVASLTTGLVAVILMVYAAAAERVCRTLEFNFGLTWRLDIWPTGFIDLAALAVVLTLAGRRKPNRELVTVVFWLMILGCFWAAFQVPAVEREDVRGFERVVVTQWASLFTIFSTMTLAGFVMVTGWHHRRRRHRAWPDRLAVLAEPPPDWPGFRYSAGVVGAVILTLCCIHVVVPGTGAAALVAGASVLTLAYRRWNDNLGDIGLGLITIGVVATIMRLFPEPSPFWTPEAWADVFNEALIGLALMSALWYWLSGVWHQQLDHGQPWTTTGRLVRNTRRVGYLVAAIGVLVSFHLALWPRFVQVYEADASTRRWFWGLTGYGLMILALILAGLRTRRSPQGWLTFFVAAAAVAFVIVRAPHSAFAHALTDYWPFMLALAAVPMVLLAAGTKHSTRWKAFFEPTYATATFIAPPLAIAGVLLTGQSPVGQLTMAHWVPPATFALLTFHYALAASAPGPGAFAAFSVLCAGIGLQALPRGTGWATLGPVYMRLMLLGLSVALLAWVIERRKPRPAVRALKWAGVVLLLFAVVAGLIAAR